MEVLDREPSNSQKKIRFELGDDILKCIFTEVGEIHERGNSCCKFYHYTLGFPYSKNFVKLVGIELKTITESFYKYTAY